MINYYVNKILNKIINKNTGDVWKLEDIPTLWRDKVKEALLKHNKEEV